MHEIANAIDVLSLIVAVGVLAIVIAIIGTTIGR